MASGCALLGEENKAAKAARHFAQVKDFVICIGYDSREVAAWHVCAQSIMKHASFPVIILPIMLSQLDGVVNPDARGSTEFSISRFLTPYLAEAAVSMFVDCDFVFLDDVWKLYQLARQNILCDVLCVKHDYIPKDKVKFKGSEQHSYPRKNWSSLMLFNQHRVSVRALTPQRVLGMTPSELHQMKWARTIGEIPIEWNWLVGEYEYRPVEDLKALHFTLGGPWFGIESEYSPVWRNAMAEMTNGAST